MANEWQSVPGNGAAFERLSEVVAKGSAIAFVGAGASAGLYPLWTGLIRLLAGEAVKQGLAAEDDAAYWLDSNTKPQQAARGIKNALGEGSYSEALRRLFAPRQAADGNYFTPVQRRLLQVGFRGIVTTNYDPGLIEARKSMRPPSAGLGVATWKDRDAVNHWLTRRVFDEAGCPILFAHGYYERSDTIVLDAAEYREAYLNDQPLVQLMTALWGQEQLVFCGFGFSDPWLDFMAEMALSRTAGRPTGAPRHFAIIGLTAPYTPHLRRAFRDQYNADPIFYPVPVLADGSQDHSELLKILDALIQGAPVAAAPSSLHHPGLAAGEGAPRDFAEATTVVQKPASAASDARQPAGPSAAQERLAIKQLENSKPYLLALGDVLAERLGISPDGAREIVDIFCRYPADIRRFFAVVRRALLKPAVTELPQVARGLAATAAAALYCLAACRLVDEAFHTKYRSEYLIPVSATEPVICAIIATAVFGGELHLVTSRDARHPRSPAPKHGFVVRLPGGTEVLEADFERAVYLVVFADDRSATELALDEGPLTAAQRYDLAERLRSLSDVHDASVVIIIDGTAPLEHCRTFANTNRVPLMIQDSQAVTAILGMPVGALAASVREFWRELTRFREAAEVPLASQGEDKRGGPVMTQPGSTYITNSTVITNSAGIATGTQAAAQVGTGHTAHTGNQAAADPAELAALVREIAAAVRYLVPPEKQAAITPYVQVLEAELRKPEKPASSAGLIKGMLENIKSGAAGLEGAGKIVALCNKAYQAVGPLFGLPPSPLP